MLFKKLPAMLLTIVMILGLSSCGSDKIPEGSVRETAKTEASYDSSSKENEDTSGVEKWDKTKTLYCEYKTDNVLLDTEKYMIRADELWFQESSADGQYLQLALTFENRTDKTADVVMSGGDTAPFTIRFQENSSGRLQLRAGAEEWDGLIGETEACRMGNYLFEIYGRDSEGSKVPENTVSFDWCVSRTAPFSDVTVGKTPEQSAEAQTEAEYDSFYSDAIIRQTEHYSMRLVSMNRGQDENGLWRVRVDYKIVNTSGARYLLFDPGKQFAGYDPGRDWFDPDESDFYSLEFTGKDKNDLTGKFSIDIKGYSWDGTSADKLFEDTVKFTLRFDRHDPVTAEN